MGRPKRPPNANHLQLNFKCASLFVVLVILAVSFLSLKLLSTLNRAMTESMDQFLNEYEKRVKELKQEGITLPEVFSGYAVD